MTYILPDLKPETIKGISFAFGIVKGKAICILYGELIEVNGFKLGRKYLDSKVNDATPQPSEQSEG